MDERLAMICKGARSKARFQGTMIILHHFFIYKFLVFVDL